MAAGGGLTIFVSLLCFAIYIAQYNEIMAKLPEGISYLPHFFNIVWAVIVLGLLSLGSWLIVKSVKM